jgi:hypothetical protein
MSAERKTAPAAGPEATAQWTQRSGLLTQLEIARHKLGGRAIAPSARSPGVLVETTLQDGRRHAGILLWASAGSCDIWFDDGLARRTRSSAIVAGTRPVPESLVRIEAEVLMFSALTEGDRVRWERDGTITEGRIVEKCRYGAIVITRSARVVAVGFRKLWPANVHARA